MHLIEILDSQRGMLGASYFNTVEEWAEVEDLLQYYLANNMLNENEVLVFVLNASNDKRKRVEENDTPSKET